MQTHTSHSKLKGQIFALFGILTLTMTTIIGFIPILFIGLFKLIPNKTWRKLCTQWIDAIIMLWCDINNWYIATFQKIKWEITGLNYLKQEDWYLVVANHQSWLDIVVLHKLFNRKIPVLKFFVKDQLKWVPFLGFAWWAMGCPFMKRYNKEYLSKKPHKQNKDIRATYKAINACKESPSSFMNFIEGTRFTTQKKALQNSPYSNLLMPKAGGISYIISSMGNKITSLLDVTIVYPGANHSLWDFLCKRVQLIKVHVRCLPIPSQFISEKLIDDKQTKTDFKNWLNEQWVTKDNLISSLK